MNSIDKLCSSVEEADREQVAHTRFLSTNEEAKEAYGEMKTELVRIGGLVPDNGDADLEEKSDSLGEELHNFIMRFQ